MKITPQMYSEMSKDASPKSNSKVNVPVAFLVGGAICALGQLIMSVLMNCGLGKENAGTWTSIILVGLSSLLTGLGWYEKLAKHAGAGTLVPITGFANAVVSPALEFKHEGMVLGTAAQMFSIAGPVIVYGVGSSFIYGLIIYIFKLY